MSVKSVGETSYEGPGVWCIWFEKVGNKQEVKEHTFAPVVLIKYAPPPIPTRRTLDRGIV